ncbi:hypothetical protein [Brevibacterium sp. 2SA]|uniref:hypothetical protein n=1 Tax=Brevibacterium sp. 2SA TaxID=2502198 RepID=UPI0010F5C4D7|nr:hypothetical protein [Brevibacterium sp. 2SA]
MRVRPARSPAAAFAPVLLEQGMTAHRVTSRADLRTFIDLSPRIAALRGETDRFVPLFAADIAEWQAGTGWFAEAVELWLVRDAAGTPVGRLMCHRSRPLAERISEGPAAEAPETLFFGALEAADEAALTAVIALIDERAHRLGADRVFGPVSPLPNVTGGLVTAGHDHPGFFDTAWNPAFFAPAFRAAGFREWGPAQTWEVAVGEIPHARATSTQWAAHGLRRRPVSRWDLRSFAGRMLPTLNAAFAALPYYTPISPAQLRSQMAGMAALMDPSLIVDVVGETEDDDAPSRCFALVLPDPAPVLRRHGGRLGPAAIADLLRHRTRLRDAVLIIQGTDPRFQGTGLLSLVIGDVYSALAAGGYRRLRVTFIAEDNPASAAVFAKAGGTPLHSLCFLDRRAPSGAAEPANGQADPASATAEPVTAPATAAAATAAATPAPAVLATSAARIDAALLTDLIATAGRSPSAHNTQPWLPRAAKIADDGSSAELVLTVDPARTLPAGDPRSEDLHLSIGCWVEALSIAAAEAGLAAAITGVDGWGPSLDVRLRVTVSDDPRGQRSAATGVDREARDGDHRDRPAFTAADLRHRQVDRGPLSRDDSAFAEAVGHADAALAPAGARLVEIPDDEWSDLLTRAARHSFADPAVFAETLAWLRLDPADPAYRQDGLSADCLRIPVAAARLAGALNRPRLRPFLARALATALAPAEWVEGLRGSRRDQRREAGRPPVGHERTGSAPDDDAAPAEDSAPGRPDPASRRPGSATTSARTGAPHHVVLAVTEDGDDAAREIALGRALLRTWLLFDRAGLRVDVHSEIKDCPATHARLRDRLGDGPATRPLAAFSVGRSTTPVPRSARR